MTANQESDERKMEKETRNKGKKKDREKDHVQENACDNSDLLLDSVYETFKSSSFAFRRSQFSVFINRARPFQVWQNSYLVLNVNLSKERLVVPTFMCLQWKLSDGKLEN